MAEFNRTRTVVDNGDVAMVIYYLGTNGTLSVTVAAGGDMSFSGAETLSIDLSTPATYTTFGILVDYINGLLDATTGKNLYKAYLVDVRREDSTDNTLLAMSATGVPAGGLKIYKDTAVALNLGIGITMQGKNQTDIGRRNLIRQITSNNTYGSGTNTILIYECKDFDPSASSRLIGQWSGGATTADQSLPNAAVEWDYYCAENARILVKMVGSAACTGRLSVIGHSEGM